MARPVKQGLSYFSHDTDAHSDMKIKMLIAFYGVEAYGIYFYLLELIYKNGQSGIDLSNESTRFLIANEMKIPIITLDRVVKKCVEVGLFSKNEWQKQKFLTSNGIQERTSLIERKRKCYRDKKEKTQFSPEKTLKTGDNLEFSPEKSTQSKVKKSKVNIEEEEEVNDLDNLTSWSAERKMYTLVSNLNRWECFRKNHFGSDKKRANEFNELIVQSLDKNEIENLTEAEYSALIPKLFPSMKSSNPINYFRRCYDELHGAVLEVV